MLYSREKSKSVALVIHRKQFIKSEPSMTAFQVDFEEIAVLYYV